MKLKKNLAFLLLFAMIISIFSTRTLSATAADETMKTTGEKKITLGIAALKGAQASNIYFGNYPQSSIGADEPKNGVNGVDWIKNSKGMYYSVEPIKWRVLDTAYDYNRDHTDEYADTTTGVFLLSDKNLDVMQYHTESNGVTWATSTMRSWLNCLKENGNESVDYSNDGFLNFTFSNGEKNAIVETTVVNDKNPTYNTSGGENTKDNVFLLSVDEVRKTAFGFTDDTKSTDKRKSANTAYTADGGRLGSGMYGVGKNDFWWLRSPGSRDSNAAIIYSSGAVSLGGRSAQSKVSAVRPAFNLNSLSVLFTSSAKDGKSTSVGEITKNAVYTPDDNEKYEYKLTIFDENRNGFTAKLKSLEENTAVITYSGATIGKNEYVSVIIKNGETVKYYGKVAEIETKNGEVSVELPNDFDMENGDTVYVFNEQCNGDYKTDFSSAFEVVLSKIQASDFAFAAPEDLVYNGTEKNATVVSNKSEMNVISVKYYNENDVETQPINAGTYSVKIDVCTDSNYAVARNITADEWKFTVSEKTITPAISLTAPVKNATPQTSVETDEYTATVVWTPEIKAGGTFAKSTEYTATVTVTPKANYTVNGVGAKEYTVSGATSVANEENSNIVIAVFPKTAKSSGNGGFVPSYTVKFNTNGGNRVSSKNVISGNQIAEPNKPIKDGFVFDGWYTDSEFAIEYDFDTKVTKNITLYAKWVADEVQNPSDDKDDDNKIYDSDGKNPFSDVFDTDWYFDDVKYIYENGLMSGISNNSFAPNENITRGMFVSVLYRLDGESVVDSSIPFADINADMYYANAVIWAEQNDIVSGYSETEYAPNESITREQIAAILYRYAQHKGYNAEQGGVQLREYEDFESISDYAVNAMTWAVNTGLMKGKSETTVNPKDNATRAEIAAILNRFIESNK